MTSKAVYAVQSGFILPASITDFARKLTKKTIFHEDFGNEVHQVNRVDDLWCCRSPVAEHTDRPPGSKCATSGLILINEAGHRLSAGGKTYPMPSGTVFQIDVSKPHGTVGEKPGLLVFLAWDSLPSERRPVREFAMEAVFSLTWEFRRLGMKA